MISDLFKVSFTYSVTFVGGREYCKQQTALNSILSCDWLIYSCVVTVSKLFKTAAKYVWPWSGKFYGDIQNINGPTEGFSMDCHFFGISAHFVGFLTFFLWAPIEKNWRTKHMIFFRQNERKDMDQRV